MSRTLAVVTEPHPSIPRSGGYIGGGRGGAGNYRRYKAEEITSGPTATGPASRANLIKPSKRIIAAGRGGAGNMFNEADESIFQFDEEMVKRREHKAPVYHIGRGGAANFVDESKPSTSRKDSAASTYSQNSNASSSAGSTSAARRSAERMFGIFGRRGS